MYNRKDTTYKTHQCFYKIIAWSIVSIAIMQPTHDALFKQNINQSYGPNFYPLLKIFSVFLVLTFILVILLSNLSVSMFGSKTNKRDDQPQIVTPLPTLADDVIIIK
jgi:hypothetical protein